MFRGNSYRIGMARVVVNENIPELIIILVV